MTEAGAEAIDVAFRLGIERLFAEVVLKTNIGSKKVLRKLGFKTFDPKFLSKATDSEYFVLVNPKL